MASAFPNGRPASFTRERTVHSMSQHATVSPSSYRRSNEGGRKSWGGDGIATGWDEDPVPFSQRTKVMSPKGQPSPRGGPSPSRRGPSPSRGGRSPARGGRSPARGGRNRMAGSPRNASSDQLAHLKNNWNAERDIPSGTVRNNPFVPKTAVDAPPPQLMHQKKQWDTSNIARGSVAARAMSMEGEPQEDNVNLPLRISTQQLERTSPRMMSPSKTNTRERETAAQPKPRRSFVVEQGTARRSFGGEPTSTANVPRSFGEPTKTGTARRSFGGEPTTTGTARRSFGGEPTTTGTARRSFGGEPTTTGAARRSFGGEPTTTGTARRSFGGEPTTTEPVRRSFGAEATPPGMARRSAPTESNSGGAPSLRGRMIENPSLSKPSAGTSANTNKWQPSREIPSGTVKGKKTKLLSPTNGTRAGKEPPFPQQDEQSEEDPWIIPSQAAATSQLFSGDWGEALAAKSSESDDWETPGKDWFRSSERQTAPSKTHDDRPFISTKRHDSRMAGQAAPQYEDPPRANRTLGIVEEKKVNNDDDDSGFIAMNPKKKVNEDPFSTTHDRDADILQAAKQKAKHTFSHPPRDSAGPFPAKTLTPARNDAPVYNRDKKAPTARAYDNDRTTKNTVQPASTAMPFDENGFMAEPSNTDSFDGDMFADARSTFKSEDSFEFAFPSSPFGGPSAEPSNGGKNGKQFQPKPSAVKSTEKSALPEVTEPTVTPSTRRNIGDHQRSANEDSQARRFADAVEDVNVFADKPNYDSFDTAPDPLARVFEEERTSAENAPKDLNRDKETERLGDHVSHSRAPNHLDGDIPAEITPTARTTARFEHTAEPPSHQYSNDNSSLDDSTAVRPGESYSDPIDLDQGAVAHYPEVPQKKQRKGFFNKLFGGGRKSKESNSGRKQNEKKKAQQKRSGRRSPKEYRHDSTLKESSRVSNQPVDNKPKPRNVDKMERRELEEKSSLTENLPDRHFHGRPGTSPSPNKRNEDDTTVSEVTMPTVLKSSTGGHSVPALPTVASHDQSSMDPQHEPADESSEVDHRPEPSNRPQLQGNGQGDSHPSEQIPSAKPSQYFKEVTMATPPPPPPPPPKAVVTQKLPSNSHTRTHSPAHVNETRNSVGALNAPLSPDAKDPELDHVLLDDDSEGTDSDPGVVPASTAKGYPAPPSIQSAQAVPMNSGNVLPKRELQERNSRPLKQDLSWLSSRRQGESKVNEVVNRAVTTGLPDQVIDLVDPVELAMGNRLTDTTRRSAAQEHSDVAPRVKEVDHADAATRMKEAGATSLSQESANRMKMKMKKMAKAGHSSARGNRTLDSDHQATQGQGLHAPPQEKKFSKASQAFHHSSQRKNYRLGPSSPSSVSSNTTDLNSVERVGRPLEQRSERKEPTVPKASKDDGSVLSYRTTDSSSVGSDIRVLRSILRRPRRAPVQEISPAPKPAFATYDESSVTDPMQRAGLRLLSAAIIPIQTEVRRFLAMRRALTKMWALIVIQTYARRWMARKAYLKDLDSIVTIQSLHRGGEVRQDLICKHICAIEIQRHVRGYQSTMQVYEDIYKVTVIQSWARMKIAIEEATHRMALVIQLQAVARGFTVRRRLERQNACAVAIQANWRCFFTRLTYQFDLLDVIIVQSVWRRKMATRRVESLRQERRQRSATLIQTNWRSHSCTSSYLLLLADVIFMQCAIRRFLAQKYVRGVRNDAAVKIQSAWRGFASYADYMFSIADIVVVQKTVRQWKAVRTVKAMRLEHHVGKALLIQVAWRKYFYARKIQRVWRLHCFQRERTEAALVIQAAWLKHCHAKRIQRAWRLYCFRRDREKAAVVVQKSWRCFVDETEYVVMKYENYAARTIQSYWRRFWCFSNFIIALDCAIQIQAVFRGFQQRRRWSVLRTSCVAIQTATRAHLAREELTRRSMIKSLSKSSNMVAYKESRAILAIQRCFRGSSARHAVDLYVAARKIQSLVRGQQARYAVKLYVCARTIQAGWRATMPRRVYTSFVAARRIQTFWRCKRMHNAYRFYRAALKIQTNYRVLRAKRDLLALRGEFLAATLIQSAWRGFVCYTDYIFTVSDIIAAQKMARRYIAQKKYGRQIQENYARGRLRKLSATKIQKVSRGFMARQRYWYTLGCTMQVQSWLRGRLVVLRLHREAKARLKLQCFARRCLGRQEYLQRRLIYMLIQTAEQERTKRIAAMVIQGFMRNCLERKHRDDAARVIQKFFLMVKYEVDRMIRATKRRRNWRRKMKHRNDKVEDQLLEEAWLSAASHGDLDNLSVGTPLSSGSANENKAGKSASARQGQRRSKKNRLPPVYSDKPSTVVRLHHDDDQSVFSGLTAASTMNYMRMPKAKPMGSREMDEDLELEEAFIDAEIQSAKERKNAERSTVSARGTATRGTRPPHLPRTQTSKGSRTSRTHH